MFECIQCGKCCKEIIINVSYSDIIRWYKTKRYDILSEVSFINNYPKKNTGGFYIAKTTFNPKQPCPFLDKDNLCTIHDTKPRACKDAPIGNLTFKVCPVFDPNDIPDRLRNRVRHDQEQDFKLAFKKYLYLLDLLHKARDKR